MRNPLFTLLAGALMIAASCTKSQNETVENEVPYAIKAKVAAMGFRTEAMQQTPEGFLVEGDILLTHAQLDEGPVPSPEIVYAQTEHYRTNKLVKNLPRTITVKTSSGSPSYFNTALAEAVSRYNAENLQLSFQVVASSASADITVQTFYQVSNTLGSAGFPSGSGNPYSTIQMNTYWYTASTSTNFLATVIAHEMGHCIGFRHTDYMNRSYSCGGVAYNEGSAGVGAVHIPGTPTGPSANSWMLACSDGTNRPFTSADKAALSTVY
ncbi:MAG: protease [Dinghuibacter sp.]|nr:protease [Dinghuibacter sp.]